MQRIFAKEKYKVTRFPGIYFLKLQYLENRFQLDIKILQESLICVLSSLTCSQIWLIPFVDDCQHAYITKLKKKPW
jgi:hypothetical protein